MATGISFYLHLAKCSNSIMRKLMGCREVGVSWPILMTALSLLMYDFLHVQFLTFTCRDSH